MSVDRPQTCPSRGGWSRSPRMLAAVVLAISVFCWVGAAAEHPDEAAAQAAQFFARGEAHYRRGDYAEAITAFRRAQELRPHASTLFNIARCYENLGDAPNALQHYQQALSLSDEASGASDIRDRIARLSALPTKVYVTSRPSGAKVTVDARPTTETKTTPLVLRLVPGPHLLVAEKPGFRLAVKRIVVSVEEQQPVEIQLVSEVRCAVAKCKPAPSAQAPPLVDARKLRLHAEATAGWGVSLGREGDDRAPLRKNPYGPPTPER